MWYLADCLELNDVTAPLMTEPTKHASTACHQLSFRLNSADAAAHPPDVKLYENQSAKYENQLHVRSEGGVGSMCAFDQVNP